jgi:hypothetical protein
MGDVGIHAQSGVDAHEHANRPLAHIVSFIGLLGLISELMGLKRWLGLQCRASGSRTHHDGDFSGGCLPADLQFLVQILRFAALQLGRISYFRPNRLPIRPPFAHVDDAALV